MNSYSYWIQTSLIITQYMTCDIHLTDTTHCPERVFTTHNSTPHERKIGPENMKPKGTRNSTLNILVNIQPLRYIVFASICDRTFSIRGILSILVIRGALELKFSSIVSTSKCFRYYEIGTSCWPREETYSFMLKIPSCNLVRCGSATSRWKTKCLSSLSLLS